MKTIKHALTAGCLAALAIVTSLFVTVSAQASIGDEAGYKHIKTANTQPSPEAKQDELTKYLKQRVGSSGISEPTETPLQGIYQVKIGNRYGYLTHDGRFAFLGDLVDLAQGDNLTDSAKKNLPIAPRMAIPEDDNPGAQDMTHWFKARAGSEEVSEPIATPVAGIYRIGIGLKFAYLADRGRYIFLGDMVDLEKGVNLTAEPRRKLVRKALDRFTAADKAIFPATGQQKAAIDVFTDTDCSTCRKFFTEVPQLQSAGISVRYLPFPDQGVGSPGYNMLRQVWCAEDRAKALAIGKGTESGNLPAGDCDAANLVDESYELGKQLSIYGTPAIITEGGDLIRGYVPYQKLIPRLLEN